MGNTSPAAVLWPALDGSRPICQLGDTTRRRQQQQQRRQSRRWWFRVGGSKGEGGWGADGGRRALYTANASAICSSWCCRSAGSGSGVGGGCTTGGWVQVYTSEYKQTSRRH